MHEPLVVAVGGDVGGHVGGGGGRAVAPEPAAEPATLRIAASVLLTIKHISN